MWRARNIIDRGSRSPARGARRGARHSARRRAFTLIEMCLGMLVTALICSAIGAFLLSVSRCWTQTENTQTGALLVNQFTTRFALRFADAKRIGSWRNGLANNAGFIYWQGDTNDDGQMQASELGVIQFNAVQQTIDLCTFVPTGAHADSVWSASDLKDAAAIDTFVLTATSSTPLIRGVKSATLAIAQDQSTTASPIAYWSLDFRQTDGTISSQSCVIAMRAPSTPP